jgi:16S rRNA (guanine966-N2)-methyltransferase
MRVVSGEARGRRLKGPTTEGVTRPMADKIKEALFSVLASLGVEWTRVLDLYAGAGGVGIEALSRGGEWCDFVDRDNAAVRVVQHNLDQLGFSARGRVHQSTALTFVRGGGARDPYDLVILDPPYADPDIVPTLEELSRSSAVADGTVVCVGHSPRVLLPDAIGQLVKLRGRCHGDSCFAVFDVVVPDVAATASLVADEGEQPA